MLYFVTDRPTVTGDIHDPIQVFFITEDHAAAISFRDGTFVLDRWSLNTVAQAKELAEACNALGGSPEESSPYEWADRGNNISPRYDVILVPRVGDDVSYGFNGDYYPCGKIVSISRHYHHSEGKTSRRRIVTKEDNGSEHIFFRLGKSGTWRKNGTWSLVPGIRNERNPSF